MKLARAGLWAASSLAAVWLLRWLMPSVWPFTLGAFLALAAEPPVGWLEARGLRRGTAAALVLGGSLTGGLAAFSSLMAALAAELSGLGLVARAMEAGRRLDAFAARLPPQVRSLADQELRRASESLGPLLAGTADSLRRWALGDLAGALFGLLVALLCAYFTCRDRRLLARGLAAALPPEWHAAARRVQRELTASLWGFLRAEMVLVAVTFAATWVGLAAMGAPYALLMACVAAALDLLPIVGPSLLFLPWAAGAWMQGMEGAAVALLLLYAGISLLRWLVTPHVFGQRLGLHPLAVLVSVYLGVEVFGTAGLLLGPLAAVAARAALAGR